MKKIRLVVSLMMLAACAQGGGEQGQPVDPGAPPSIRRGIGAIAFIRSVPDRSMSDGIVPAASLMLLPVDGDPRVLDAAARATPAWSPDGSTLAYLGRGGLWLLTQGGEPERLTRCHPSTCFGDGPPGWSPDGGRVAFSSDREGGVGLWTVAAAGGEPAALAGDLRVQGSPSWSPDGSTIAVIATAAGGKRVVLVDATSGEVTETLAPEGIDLGGTVAWSPDGELLLVDGAATGPTPDVEGVFVVRPDGSDLRSLTTCADPGCIDVFPMWSPDGTRVLFTRGRCDALGSDCYSGDLFEISAGGGRPEQLTGGPSLDCCAAWQPVSTG